LSTLFYRIDVFRAGCYSVYMIILNINELLKFCLDNVTNYIGAVVLLLILGVLAVGLLTHLFEKLGSVIITVMMIARGQSADEIIKQTTDED